MSSIPLPDDAGRVDTFTRLEGEEAVHMQAVVPVDPATGDPLPLAREATLAALASAVDTLNAAATAIRDAVGALESRTVAVDTGAIAGTVALDGPTLAALAQVDTGLEQPLTVAQLHAAAVPVAGEFYPNLQPVADANTQAILTAINGLTDTMVALLAGIYEKMPRATANDQAAVSVEGGTLATVSAVTTVSTVTAVTGVGNVTNVAGHGGRYASGDAIQMAGATYLYDRITVS